MENQSFNRSDSTTLNRVLSDQFPELHQLGRRCDQSLLCQDGEVVFGRVGWVLEAGADSSEG